MVERGDATPEDIDQAMELGAGYRKWTSSTICSITREMADIQAMGVRLFLNSSLVSQSLATSSPSRHLPLPSCQTVHVMDHTTTTPKQTASADHQPFKLLDFVGLDTTSYIADGWREKAKQGAISEELVRPIPMLENMVKEGKMGRKSGKGFYNVRFHLCGDGDECRWWASEMRHGAR
jgi:3-hydroxyacyl-CoA dehydrogenase